MASSSSAPNIGLTPGPIDTSVLYEQGRHISELIWRDDTESRLESHNHNRFPEILDRRVLDYIKTAGFYGVYMLGFAKINCSLITALVERWRPETNSFHMTVGECTITLQDVEILAGVRVDGLSVIRSEVGEGPIARKALVPRLLGKLPPDDKFNKAGGLSLKWLSEEFNDSDLDNDASDEDIQAYARASILRIIGSSYLQDKQGSHVPLFFLPFLEDLTACGLYSWGSAILAFLYRALFRASTGQVKSINGALVILQCWAWSRFSSIRPFSQLAPEVVAHEGYPAPPYGRRWVDSTHHGDGGYGHSVRVFRDQFDKMQPTQVVWEPYAAVMDDLPNSTLINKSKTLHRDTEPPYIPSSLSLSLSLSIKMVKVPLVVPRIADRGKVSNLRLMRPDLFLWKDQISCSSMTTAISTIDKEKPEAKEEEEPVIYVRMHSKFSEGSYLPYDWFRLNNNDEVSHKQPICRCGAVEDLTPAFVQPKYRLYSAVAAVGHVIYLFGGSDLDNRTDCAEVSCIDTHHPNEGWKVCKNPMPKARSMSFAITLDNERVLLVGGYRIPDVDRTFSQMYNSCTDEWSALESCPKIPHSPFVKGHGVVVKEEEGKKTMMVLMHELGAPHLFTYNVNTDSWGIRWEAEFGTEYDSGALVGDIYYVLDDTYGAKSSASVTLCGFDISKERAKCLPVEILVEKKKNRKKKTSGGKVWLPSADDMTQLFSFGESKLAMVWYDHCPHSRNENDQLSFYWSIFEMTKEDTDDDGGSKLVARPFSHVCYHISYNGIFGVDSMVPVFPSKGGPNANLATN